MHRDRLPPLFGGLLGNDPRIRILAELVNDPFYAFIAEEMAARAMITEPYAINMLNRLTRDRFCIMTDHTYRANVASKRFLALLSLSVAAADDRDDGTRLDKFLNDCFVAGRLQGGDDV